MPRRLAKTSSRVGGHGHDRRGGCQKFGDIQSSVCATVEGSLSLALLPACTIHLANHDKELLHIGQVETSRYDERQFVGAWVDQEQREQLTELTRQQDRSVSAVIRRALERERQ